MLAAERSVDPQNLVNESCTPVNGTKGQTRNVPLSARVLVILLALGTPPAVKTVRAATAPYPKSTFITGIYFHLSTLQNACPGNGKKATEATTGRSLGRMTATNTPNRSTADWVNWIGVLP